MDEPLRFKLENGLRATLHPADSWLLQQLLKKCRGKHVNTTRLLLLVKTKDLCVVEVRIKGECLYLLNWAPLPAQQGIVKKLETDMKSTVQENYAIIYRHTVHTILTSANLVFVKAIINKLRPEIALLIT